MYLAGGGLKPGQQGLKIRLISGYGKTANSFTTVQPVEKINQL